MENQNNIHKRLVFVDERRAYTGSQKARVIVWGKHIDRESEKKVFKGYLKMLSNAVHIVAVVASIQFDK